MFDNIRKLQLNNNNRHIIFFRRKFANKLVYLLRNISFIFLFVIIITKCQEKSSEQDKFTAGARQNRWVELEAVWVGLGDRNGEIDKERGMACVETAEFSNNNEYIVSGSALGSEVIVWNTKTGKKVFEHVYDNQVEVTAFSPDDKYFLAGGGFKKLVIWKTSDWKLHKEINFLASIEGLRFSHDNKLLAVGDEAGMITLIDVSSWTVIKTAMHGYNEITNIDSTLLFQSDVNSIDFSPDDQYLVSGGIDGKIKIWFLPELKIIKTIDAHSSSVKSVRINPKGHCIASASVALFPGGIESLSGDNSIKIWDFNTSDLIHTLKFPLGMEAVEFTPDGDYLMGGGREGKYNVEGESGEGNIYVYYIPDNIHTEPILQVHKEPVFRSEYLDISNDGKLLVSSHEDGTVRLWNVKYY